MTTALGFLNCLTVSRLLGWRVLGPGEAPILMQVLTITSSGAYRLVQALNKDRLYHLKLAQKSVYYALRECPNNEKEMD